MVTAGGSGLSCKFTLKERVNMGAHAKVPKSPNAVHAEMLALVELLEGEYERMRDVNAQVANEGKQRLSEIRIAIRQSDKSRAKELSIAVAQEVLAKLAWEAIKWLISITTSIYLLTALLSRVLLYESRRNGKNAPYIGRAKASRACFTRWDFGLVAFVGRGWPS